MVIWVVKFSREDYKTIILKVKYSVLLLYSVELSKIDSILLLHSVELSKIGHHLSNIKFESHPWKLDNPYYRNSLDPSWCLCKGFLIRTKAIQLTLTYDVFDPSLSQKFNRKNKYLSLYNRVDWNFYNYICALNDM